MAPDAAKDVVDAARAAALAAHCAAGLAASAGVRPAARMLRIAGALSRSAVAAHTCPFRRRLLHWLVPLVRLPSFVRGRGGDAARSRRVTCTWPLYPWLWCSRVLAGPPPVLFVDVSVFVLGKTRTLKAKTLREHSPRRCSPPSSSTSLLVGFLALPALVSSQMAKQPCWGAWSHDPSSLAASPSCRLMRWLGVTLLWSTLLARRSGSMKPICMIHLDREGVSLASRTSECRMFDVCR
jgi:hypothetical protein